MGEVEGMQAEQSNGEQRQPQGQERPDHEGHVGQRRLTFVVTWWGDKQPPREAREGTREGVAVRAPTEADCGSLQWPREAKPEAMEEGTAGTGASCCEQEPVPPGMQPLWQRVGPVVSSAGVGSPREAVPLVTSAAWVQQAVQPALRLLFCLRSETEIEEVYERAIT